MVIFEHFSRKISHFQGRLKNQVLLKTAFKFKHFSGCVGTMCYDVLPDNVLEYVYPTGTRRNDNVIMTSKRRRDVVLTS